MSAAVHLANRFWGSITAKPLSDTEAAWVDSYLSGNTGLQQLWSLQCKQDQRHLYGVAKSVELEFSKLDKTSELQQDILLAALFHDSGKVISNLGTFSRVAATLFWGAIGAKVQSKLIQKRPRLLARLVDYRLHPEIGSDLLVKAGAPSLAIDWALQHHMPRAKWTIDPVIGDILKSCDDD